MKKTLTLESKINRLVQYSGIKFKSGETIVVEASWASNIAEGEFMETRLYGSKGGLVQRNVGEGYKFEAEIFLENNGCQFDMKLHLPGPNAKHSMRYFLDCIQNNNPHIATAKEGLIGMELLDAIYLSAKKGGPVKIIV